MGCAKGFLVKDLLNLGIDAFGLDISEYALLNCEVETAGRLYMGSADYLPFPDNSFDAIVSINTIHNLPKNLCKLALREIERIAPGKGFVQVDSYFNKKQKSVFEAWVLTALTHNYPEEWIRCFKETGYTGDYSFIYFE